MSKLPSLFEWYAIVVPSLILHYYAAWGYIPLAANALREGREARQA